MCCSQPLCRSMNTMTVSPRDIKTYVGTHVCVPFFNSSSMVFQYHNKLAKFLFAIANPTIEPASVMLTFLYIIFIYLFISFFFSGTHYGNDLCITICSLVLTEGKTGSV